jgi:hypothetical protein
MRTALIAAVSFSAHPAAAAEGPWCAFISLGTGSVYEDCQYSSIETCRPNVLAGNLGFCNPNPRWVEPVPQSRVRHKGRVQNG